MGYSDLSSLNCKVSLFSRFFCSLFEVLIDRSFCLSVFLSFLAVLAVLAVMGGCAWWASWASCAVENPSLQACPAEFLTARGGLT